MFVSFQSFSEVWEFVLKYLERVDDDHVNALDWDFLYRNSTGSASPSVHRQREQQHVDNPSAYRRGNRNTETRDSEI